MMHVATASASAHRAPALTLTDLVLQFVAREPQRALYRFLHAHGEQSLSLAELDRRARAGAGALAAAGVRPGQRVLLLFPQGLEFIVAFLSCLYGGVVAVTNPFPTRPLRRILPRLRAIARDSRPHAVLSSLDRGDSVAREIIAQAPELAQLAWLCLADAADERLAAQSPVYCALPTTTAFLQYTSGSTSAPRGVVVSHQNVLANCRAARQPPGSKILSWLPQYHDFGLIYGILLPLLAEVDSVLMSPAAFLQRPLRWLEAISREGATHSPAPNFAFELCVRSVGAEQRAGLDLSCWRAAVIGAEPIRAATLERFLATFAASGVRPNLFLPAYGLAEATLMVTRRPEGSEARYHQLPAAVAPMVSCGAPGPETRIAIVDPASLARCGEAEVGEIWVSGSAVAEGYFGRSDESASTFRAFTAEGDGPYLRTGDLGLLQAGELYVAGRRKEVIVVRGAKYYPQDIEATVERCHPALAPAGVAAIGVAGADGDGVVVVVEISRAAQRAGEAPLIVAAIQRAVALEHGLSLRAVELVAPGQLPKTTSGKLQRVECKARYESSTLERLPVDAAGPVIESPLSAGPGTAEATPVRRAAELIQLVGALLRRTPPPPIDAATPLAEVGLDSVMFAELSSELESRFRCLIPLPDLFGLTIGQLAERIERFEAERPPMPPRDEAPTRSEPRFDCQIQVEPGLPAAPGVVRLGSRRNVLDFTLFCFGDLGAGAGSAYELVLDCARLADSLGLTAVWLPERHFHSFGGISPNPTVLAAALTQTTNRLRLRAGSVILPLHHPVRVAEEWATIDNLSAGRVDLAFGWGWNPNDFVLAPARFAARQASTLTEIETIQRLWRGGAARSKNGEGVTVDYRLYPRPLQAELPVWLTCTRSPESFIVAGARGYNVLTALLFQNVDELAANLALYRAARAQNGHDPDQGIVSLMLHTWLGPDDEQARQVVEQPFAKYLYSSRSLWRQGAARLEQLDEAQRAVTLHNAFERYFDSAALFGRPKSKLALVNKLRAAGVNEIACLVDFGVASPRVLEGIHYIEELRRLTNENAGPVIHAH
jgi:natural product biosynthesis luciferase-like monooxygenase protein